jgi:hypothetical protein
MPNTFGSFQLTTVANLPNVTVAFPGEHWSDGKAGSAIVPGQLVIPSASAVTSTFHQLNPNRTWVVAPSGALDPRAAIALRTVQIPDTNAGNIYNEQLTPNQIMNRVIPIGEYVHAYRSGSFHLTLCAPDATYQNGDYLTWDPAATAMTGKPAGSGAWKKTGTAANALFEVEEWRPLSSDNTQGVVTARTLRTQA